MLVSLSRARLLMRASVLLAILLIAAQILPPATAASANPAAGPADPANDGLTSAFLKRLLDEINKRRDRIGTQHLDYIPPEAAAPLDGFLAKTMPSLAWPRPCGHHLVGGAFSWDYVFATGFGGEARGEVLACPGPEPYWTPARAAEQWWESPSHFAVLYADRYADALACGVAGMRSSVQIGQQKGKTETADAASAVLCVTFHEGEASSPAATGSVARESADWEDGQMTDEEPASAVAPPIEPPAYVQAGALPGETPSQGSMVTLTRRTIRRMRP
jgi:hypothetical protein